MNHPGLQVNYYYYLRSTNKGTGEGHHMLRSTCGDQGEAQLGSACPLPAGLQAGPQEAGRGPEHRELVQLATIGLNSGHRHRAGCGVSGAQAGGPSRKLWDHKATWSLVAGSQISLGWNSP